MPCLHVHDSGRLIPAAVWKDTKVLFILQRKDSVFVLLLAVHCPQFCHILSQTHSLIPTFRNKERGRTLCFPWSAAGDTENIFAIVTYPSVSHRTSLQICCLLLSPICSSGPWVKQSSLRWTNCYKLSYLFLPLISVFLPKASQKAWLRQLI